MKCSRRRFNRGALAALLLAKLFLRSKGAMSGAALLFHTAPLHALGTPEVTVKEVQLQGIDREQLRLLVILKMDNSNPIPIPLSTIQFLARIEDRELAKGETTESLRLPALGTADASFKVLIPLRAIPGALDRGLVALFGEGLRYDIEGTAELGGMFRIPFRKTGRLTRAQLLAALRA
jgi:LEA14-like dessication related protein